jgi:hypothetical protein
MVQLTLMAPRAAYNLLLNQCVKFADATGAAAAQKGAAGSWGRAGRYALTR